MSSVFSLSSVTSRLSSWSKPHRVVAAALVGALTLLVSPRTPWEILSTPIRVPGIDYSPGALDAAGSSQSLGEAVRGLDVALSLILASQIARLRTHA